ncbi:MAG: transcriptional repressor [Dehalococcoidia bacterium]|nr:MAG: transcriptional repressor [Dehalococcoidia bacterium]
MSCVTTFKEQGLRLTPQRRLITDIIYSADAHLSAEDIITQVQNKMPGVNKSTIYRTLEILEKKGCVVKSELSGRSIYHHAEEGHHHHLICSECGKSIDCDDNLFAQVKNVLKEKFGFSVDLDHLVIRGLCNNCKGKS